MLVCLYEDRPEQISGLKLLLLSLRRYCPSWAVRLRFPGVPDDLRFWLASFRNITVLTDKLSVSGSFDVKPKVLLDGLSVSHQCLWLDTDILVNGNLEFLERDPPEVLVVSQDPWEYEAGSSHRCTTWQMSVGRELEGPFNSCVVRVSRLHGKLLCSWQKALSTHTYLREKEKPVKHRNQHMLSDQDALSALLASVDFKDIVLHKLLHPSDVLQHHGAGAYGLLHRWQNLRTGLPPLLHAMGSVKPWRAPTHPHLLRQPRAYYERTYLELSPYVHLARQYRPLLNDECDWMDIQTFAGNLGSLATLNNPYLKGALQATLHRILKGL
jgi:hypothetical protein